MWRKLSDEVENNTLNVLEIKVYAITYKKIILQNSHQEKNVKQQAGFTKILVPGAKEKTSKRIVS